MIDASCTKASRRGTLNDSITSGAGSRAGYMGEEALAAYLDATIVDQKGYDLVKDGRTIEVKTKRRTVRPRGSYEVSIAATSRHQSPDLYAFVSLQFAHSRLVDGITLYTDLLAVWLLGYKTPIDFYRDSRLWEPGDIDLTNQFRATVRMFNLPIHMLENEYDFAAVR